MVDGGVDRDPVDPGVQVSAFAERLHRLEDLDEDGLGDVLGVGVVAGQLEGQAVDPLLVRLDELAEGPGFAPSEPLRQPVICCRIHRLHMLDGPAGKEVGKRAFFPLWKGGLRGF